MRKQVFTYGDAISGYRAMPHPTKRNEFVGEAQPATVVGFSHPNLAKRDWGWRGSVLVEFADGHKAWNSLH